MALIECKECKKEISEDAKSCPGCGAKVPKVKLWLWLPLTFIFLLFLYSITRTSSPEDDAKWHDKEIIKKCWELYNKKSNTDSVKLLLAKTCEKYEQDFLTTYGIKP